MTTSHALCLKAQAQCAKATDLASPRFSPRFSADHPPVHGFSPARRAWCDIVTRKTYSPDVGWMTSDDYLAWKEKA